jgi:hypothetical protein
LLFSDGCLRKTKFTVPWQEWVYFLIFNFLAGPSLLHSYSRSTQPNRKPTKKNPPYPETDLSLLLLHWTENAATLWAESHIISLRTHSVTEINSTTTRQPLQCNTHSLCLCLCVAAVLDTSSSPEEKAKLGKHKNKKGKPSNWVLKDPQSKQWVQTFLPESAVENLER